MENPIVSVIVPMQNAEQFVRETLESILAEQQIPLEVIVVDDKSTDASSDCVRALADSRIRLIDGPGRGIAACLNSGYSAANGALVMRCDADDQYPPQRIRKQVEWMQANPQFDAVCGSFATIDSGGKLVANLHCGEAFSDITEELLNGISRTHLCTFAIRLPAMRKISGFREYFETAEDLDFQFRLAEIGHVAYVPEICYLYRIHSASITHSQPNNRRLFFETTAKQFSLQRRERGADALQDNIPPFPPDGGKAKSSAASHHVQGILLGRAWMEYGEGQTQRSLATAARALATNPISISTWKSALALVVKIMRNFWRTNF
jgi:glycosyltransferase involved in cell wall biosynthesis